VDLPAQVFVVENYLVSRAVNGQKALDLLHSMKELPSLILLDITMPVMDGIEFRQEQKRDPRLAKIPVIVMTVDRYRSDASA
jgi:CheY-like chemotaxis protein